MESRSSRSSEMESGTLRARVRVGIRLGIIVAMPLSVLCVVAAAGGSLLVSWTWLERGAFVLLAFLVPLVLGTITGVFIGVFSGFLSGYPLYLSVGAVYGMVISFGMRLLPGDPAASWSVGWIAVTVVLGLGIGTFLSTALWFVMRKD